MVPPPGLRYPCSNGRKYNVLWDQEYSWLRYSVVMQLIVATASCLVTRFVEKELTLPLLFKSLGTMTGKMQRLLAEVSKLMILVKHTLKKLPSADLKVSTRVCQVRMKAR